MSDSSEPVEGLSEEQRRRRRTRAYLSMWALPEDVDAIAVPLESNTTIGGRDAIVGRAKAYCLVSLKGQGLSQHEVFAFADAYEVWDHLDLVENDYVLDPNPDDATDRTFAWRSEALWVLEWTLGLVRHLQFPDRSADPAEAVRLCIQDLCAPSSLDLTMRPTKEILDAADVAQCLDAIAAAARAQNVDAPQSMHPGVVHERHQAFRWLVGAVTKG